MTTTNRSDNQNEKQVPIPPIEPSRTLHKSIQFWSEILMTLDKKIQFMEESLSFGEISVHFKIWRGRITDISWEDKVNDKMIVEKAGGTNSALEEDRHPNGK